MYTCQSHYAAHHGKSGETAGANMLQNPLSCRGSHTKTGFAKLRGPCCGVDAASDAPPTTGRDKEVQQIARLMIERCGT